MGGSYSLVKSDPGSSVSKADYIAEHQNHVDNHTLSTVDDYSSNTSQMQTTTDPYPSGAESLATSGAGELERLRYMIKAIIGKDQWYYDSPDYYSMINYRRPVLEYVSSTQVDVENNTNTSNETMIVFPDGDVRSVTEDTSSANKYRRFDITATAEYTSGTEDSGLYTSLSEAANTRYTIYAVKSTIDTSKFVLVGDTTRPNDSTTLNTRYAANGWVPLGVVANGDQVSSTTDILSFVQVGNKTILRNVYSGGISNQGIQVDYQNPASSASYTYAAGTGSGQIPVGLDIVLYVGSNDPAGSAAGVKFTNQAGTILYGGVANSDDDTTFQAWCSAADGAKVVGAATSRHEIGLAGWIDKYLGGR